MAGTGRGLWSPRADGITIRVRVQPGASTDCVGEVIRLADGRAVLAVRLRAIPEKGKANQALCRLLGKRMGVAAGRVSVASDRHDRIKTVHVEGAPAELAAALGALGVMT